MHDFGIFLELEPDEEEKAELEKTYTNSFTSKKYRIRRCNRYKRNKKYLNLANQLLKK